MPTRAAVVPRALAVLLQVNSAEPENLDAEAFPPKPVQCGRCGRELDSVAFSRNALGMTDKGKQATCKECTEASVMQREQAALKRCSRDGRRTGEAEVAQARWRRTARTRGGEACKNLSEATEPASSATDPFVFQSRRPDLDSDEEAADIQTGNAAISSDDNAEHEVYSSHN